MLSIALSLPAISAPSLSFPIAKEDLPVTRDSGRWTSNWVEFEVPAGLVSFQIIATGSANSILQVTDLVDPAGEVFVASGGNPNFHAYSQPELQNVISPNRSTGTL